MALNATVGDSLANSYPTVAEANEYFGDRVHAEDWFDYDAQASALITCSRMLDWYGRWKGYKTSQIQGMAWPRTDAVRSDGTTIDSTIIPTEVKTAVFELVLISLDEDRTADDPMAGLKQVEAGSLMAEAFPAGRESTQRDIIPEHIRKIIYDLIRRGDMAVIRLKRG